MVEMMYKVMVIGHDGEILAEQTAGNATSAETLAKQQLRSRDSAAVAIYRYRRALGCYTHYKTVFRDNTLANWRVEE